jgi:uncharacterized membrane-anchored protein YhcB (DUF1043 family)
MMNSILAFWTPGPLELLVIVIVCLLTFVLPIIVVVLVVRYVLRSSRENRRLGLEVDKLAKELEQMRKKAQGPDKGNSSDE